MSSAPHMSEISVKKQNQRNYKYLAHQASKLEKMAKIMDTDVGRKYTC